jgi:hypothetical protein
VRLHAFRAERERLVLGNDGMLLWQQGRSRLEHLLQSVYLMLEDSLQAITE